MPMRGIFRRVKGPYFDEASSNAWPVGLKKWTKAHPLLAQNCKGFRYTALCRNCPFTFDLSTSKLDSFSVFIIKKKRRQIKATRGTVFMRCNQWEDRMSLIQLMEDVITGDEQS